MFEINDHLLASSFAVGFGVSNEDDILKILFTHLLILTFYMVVNLKS